MATFLANYLMNEGQGNTILDTSGNNHNGTIIDAVWSDGRGGSQKSLLFNGGTAYVDLGTYDLNATNFSILAWVKFNSFTISTAKIFSKADGNATQDHWCSLGTINPGVMSQRRLIKLNGTTVDKNDGNQSALVIDTWYLLGFTYDKDIAKPTVFYRDGQATTTFTGTGNLSQDNTISVYMGNNPVTKDKGLDGYIESLFVWNGTLTAQEVEDVYNAPIPSEPVDDTEEISNRRRLFMIKNIL